MAKYIIDTDSGTCTLYTGTTTAVPEGTRMVEILAAHRGDTEYNGFCAVIQKWYYGSVVKSAWCATALSYLLNQIGLSQHKAENVNKLRLSLKNDHYNGTYYEGKDIPKTIQKGDILFWLWSGDTMTDTSSKHVGLAEYDTNTDTIYCIGGNQKDKICTLAYNRKNLYAIYRLR